MLTALQSLADSQVFWMQVTIPAHILMHIPNLATTSTDTITFTCTKTFTTLAATSTTILLLLVVEARLAPGLSLLTLTTKTILHDHTTTIAIGPRTATRATRAVRLLPNILRTAITISHARCASAKIDLPKILPSTKMADLAAETVQGAGPQ